MIKRITAGLFIGAALAGALLAAYFFNSIYITILFCLILLIGTIEVSNAAKNLSKKLTFLIYLYVGMFCLLNILCVTVSSLEFFFPYLTLFILAAFVITGASVSIFAGLNVSELMTYIFILVYPSLLAAPILYLNQLEGYNIFAVSLILLTSTFTDMFAYFTGVLFGKHKLTPVSPKKTVEGAVGGLIGGVIGALCLYFAVVYFYFFTLSAAVFSKIWIYLAMGLFCSLFTQIGDLFASLIKRHFGIKDFSKILFSHGGVMDRFDGIIINGCFVSGVFLILTNIN